MELLISFITGSIVAYYLVFTLIVFMLGVPLFFACFTLVDGVVAESLNIDHTSKLYDIFVWMSIFLSIHTTCLISFHVLNFAGISTPNPNFDVSREIADQEFQSLAEKADKLSIMLESPGQLKLSEVPQIAQETLDLAGDLKKQFQGQQEVVLQLRKKVEEESARAAEAQKLAKEVKTLTQSQLEAVKFLITEDARTEANRSFIMGLVVSFPLGIVASFLASIIHGRAFKKTS